MRAFLTVTVLGMLGCASKDAPGPKRVEQEPAQWDYKKIRETREAEQAQTPQSGDNSTDDESNCIVLTAEQMKRSKSSGCRKMDPREGHGEGTYCCPRE